MKASKTDLRLLTILHHLGNGYTFSLETTRFVLDTEGKVTKVETIDYRSGELCFNGSPLRYFAAEAPALLARALEKQYGKFTRVQPYTVVGVTPQTGEGYSETVFTNGVDEAAYRVLNKQDILVAAVYEGYLPLPFLANDETYLPRINHLQ